jgi:hypothetical protein
VQRRPAGGAGGAVRAAGRSLGDDELVEGVGRLATLLAEAR